MALRPASRVASVGESVGILWRCAAALHIADHDNAAGGIGAAGRERGVHGPGLSCARLACLSQLKLCILPLGEQAHRAAFPQERKTLVEQRLKRSDGACRDDIHRALGARCEILDSRRMYARRRFGEALTLPHERRLFAIAFTATHLAPS